MSYICESAISNFRQVFQSGSSILPAHCHAESIVHSMMADLLLIFFQLSAISSFLF